MNLWEQLRKHVEAAGPTDDEWRRVLKVRDELKAARAKREQKKAHK